MSKDLINVSMSVNLEIVFLNGLIFLKEEIIYFANFFFCFYSHIFLCFEIKFLCKRHTRDKTTFSETAVKFKNKS